MFIKRLKSVPLGTGSFGTKNKLIFGLMIFILMFIFTFPIFADDELEETSITEEEMEQILETGVDISDIPTINSRNAIIYDRTARANPIWKGRK